MAEHDPGGVVGQGYLGYFGLEATMRQMLQTLVSLLITVIAVGCQFTTPDGRALNIRQYDSILVKDVQLAPEVSEAQIGPLLEGYIAVTTLESKKWKLAGDFDLDAFAKTVEAYATMSGTINGQPVPPLMTREQFLKKHAEANEKWKAKLAEQKGTKPVSLRIHESTAGRLTNAAAALMWRGGQNRR